jgi:hypothetical protein
VKPTIAHKFWLGKDYLGDRGFDWWKTLKWNYGRKSSRI